jgi:hypothetical protein
MQVIAGSNQTITADHLADGGGPVSFGVFHPKNI